MSKTRRVKAQFVASSGDVLSPHARTGLQWAVGLLDREDGYPSSPAGKYSYTDLILFESEDTVCQIELFNTVSGLRHRLNVGISWLVDNTLNRLFGMRIGHVSYARSTAFIKYIASARPFSLWSSSWCAGNTKVLHFSTPKKADIYVAHLAANPRIRYWHFKLS